MSAYTQIAVTTRERFMQMAQDEMAAFEKREAEFMKKDRAERANQLHLPFGDNVQWAAA
ncbi:hypothetical protein [Tardiphaga sp.]|uniref:hypothetical protein n=1 Tax=Tardiphaga sp. TaxID=1926292 RepID=UPI0019B43C6B|nr:hypothetical protein [Tardiphaga sp.]MBC7579923.1 hypothetical protein [Tardiphaga sp.]